MVTAGAAALAVVFVLLIQCLVLIQGMLERA